MKVPAIKKRGKEGKQGMVDKRILDVKYKKIEKRLSEPEGCVKNLSEQVCKVLYMGIYDENAKDEKSKAEKERKIKNFQERSRFEINRIIKDYVRERYHLELDEKRVRKKNGQMIEQLEERMEKETDEKERKNMEKEREKFQELRSDGKPLRPLFTDLLEETENFDKEEYDRRERFKINKQKINGDFAAYYRGIMERILEMPQYLEEDLNYIILQELSSMEKGKCKINIGIFSKWEEDFYFLRFPQTASKDDKKNAENQLKKTKETLQEETGFPIKFESYADDENKCLCLQETNIKIQLALLFYPEFRKRFLKGRNMKRYNFHELCGIIKNIREIQPEKDEIEGVEWETEDILFPYLIEYLTGVNLCMEYATYYAAIEGNSQNKNEARKYLDKIFGYLCEMPNAFSRFQIMKDFMDSVLLFDNEITEQLVIIGNVMGILGDYFKDASKKITAIVKNALNDEKLRVQYLCELRKKCCGIDYGKNISGAKGGNGYIFVKQYKNLNQYSAIYEDLQRIYIKRLN